MAKFLKLKCECGNEQVTSATPAMEVKCNKCGNTIAQSTGGKAAVNAEIVETY